MDYKVLGSKIIQGLRGESTQTEVNDFFEVDFNLCAKWEKGRQLIEWSDFLKLCTFAKKDISIALNRAIGIDKKNVSSSTIANYAFSHLSLKEVSQKISLNEVQLKKRVSGESKKDFSLGEVLEFIDVFFPSRIYIFLQILLPNINSREVYQYHLKSNNLANLLNKYPEIEIVRHLLAALELIGEKYKVGDLSQKGFLSLSKEKEIIDVMKDNSFLELVEGDIKLIDISSIRDINSDFSRQRTVDILNSCHDYYRQKLDDEVFIDKSFEILGYKNILLSEDQTVELIEMIQRFFSEVDKKTFLRPLVKNKKNKVNFYRFIISLFPNKSIDGLPTKKSS